MNRPHDYFITGTDTGIGKTWSTVAIMRTFQAQQISVLGMKPVASGCLQTANGLRNEDALLLQTHASFAVPYETVNPYAFEPPIAPHIAARHSGTTIELNAITAAYHQLAEQADSVVVEGVGGWQVPLNADQTVADLAFALGLPVILVVGMRLGCLNHALLSDAAIGRSRLVRAGWIANCIDPDFAFIEDNIATLQQKINAPLLGVIPYLTALNTDVLARRLGNFPFKNR